MEAAVGTCSSCTILSELTVLIISEDLCLYDHDVHLILTTLFELVRVSSITETNHRIMSKSERTVVLV